MVGPGTLALELVRELLDALELKHTMAVFLPEANLLQPSSQGQQPEAARVRRGPCVGHPCVRSVCLLWTELFILYVL